MIKMPQLMQFSFVVEDIESAIQHWASHFQVGPFFVVERVEYEECMFRGLPTDIDMSVAIAYHGEIQIELVQQYNDAPSIFNEFVSQRGFGLQHVAAVSQDLTLDLKKYAERGLLPIQQGRASNGTVFAYMDCADNPVPGTMLELVQLPEKIISAFDFMRNAAAKWNPESDSPRYR